MANQEEFEIEKEVNKEDAQESEDLLNTNSNDSEVDLRKKLGILADSLSRDSLLSSESYTFLKTMSSTGETGKKEDLEMLKKAYEFNKSLQEKAKDCANWIEKAIQDSYIAESDKNFYLERIIQSSEFVGKVIESERYIKEKLEEAKKYKEEHSLLLMNPLVKNGNELQITNSSTIKILDEKKFLKMKPKEKKEYLKHCVENLKKAEKYAEESEKKEAKEIDKKYADKLEKFQSENEIIGKHSAKEFNRWMENIEGVEAKRDALKELNDDEGGQMERYAKLWGKIRENLEGQELDDMEKMRNKDEIGYTEIFTEYGKSAKRLDDRYEKELDKYVKAGDIDNKAKEKFMSNPDGMKNVTDFNKKYRYINNLPNEIDKYKESHDETNEPQEKESDSTVDMSDPLAAVTNLTAKRAIRSTIDDLKKDGSEKASSFLRIIKSVTRGNQQSESYDASGFQSSLRKKREKKIKEEVAENETADNNVMDFQQKLREQREEKKVATKRSWNPFAKKAQPEQAGEGQLGEVTDIESKRTSKSIDKSAIKEEVDELKEVSNAKVIDDRGFFEVQMEDERNTIADITRSEARSRLLFENQRKQYKGKQDGGKDNMTFAVKTEGSQTIELDLTQVRAMEKALEKEKASNLDDVEYRKAS